MRKNSGSSSWPLSKTSPNRVGLCPKRLERVEAYLDRIVAERTLAGAITVVARQGRIAHLHCYGMQDVEKGIAMREDTLFRIYSMTKPIVCVATMMLYEEMKLSLQDPVRRFLPEFADLKVKVTEANGNTKLVPPKRDITIHDLLTHTGGLGYALAQLYGNSGKDLAAFIKDFCKEPLLGHPGELWRYSASNDILGRIIEIISGQTLDVFFHERIFAPLGMHDTSFFVPPSKHARLAVLYEHDANARIVRRQTEDRPYLEKPAFLSGGGGLVSSTPDYLRFALMMLGGGALGKTRILSPKTVDFMRQDHLPPGHPAIERFKVEVFGHGQARVGRCGACSSQSTPARRRWPELRAGCASRSRAPQR
ncbi:MAG: serine hydrolase domain-containing protein, partial [Planctomycetota bacterium]